MSDLVPWYVRYILHDKMAREGKRDSSRQISLGAGCKHYKSDS